MQGIAKAEQAGVTLALEEVGRPLVLNTAHILELIDACGGSRALGIYLDVGNATRRGLDPAAEIRTAKGRAAMVHVKDWDPNGRGSGRLGAGAVDFRAPVAALQEIGYTGFLVVELAPDPADPNVVARESVDYLQNLLGRQSTAL
jgi:L-ribulose-5-phosphate 3-epimerase